MMADMTTTLVTRHSWHSNAQQHMLRVVDFFTAKLGRTPITAPHLATGTRGEEAALFHLRRNGYIIVARQWRSAKLRGDLDLIGWDGDILCFIEVKSRTHRKWGPAEAAVDAEKKRMLRLMARAYLRRYRNSEDLDVRFDVVSVYLGNAKPEFEILKDWFSRS